MMLTASPASFFHSSKVQALKETLPDFADKSLDSTLPSKPCISSNHLHLEAALPEDVKYSG